MGNSSKLYSKTMVSYRQKLMIGIFYGLARVSHLKNMKG